MSIRPGLVTGLLVTGLLVGAAALGAGCNGNIVGGRVTINRDLGGDGGVVTPVDLARPPTGDLTGIVYDLAPPGPNACGSYEPSCTNVGVGPSTGKPFPLQSDPQPDPNQKDNGVSRDTGGNLVLDVSKGSFDFLWVANSNDFSGVGSVSKLDSKKIRETARYLPYTCSSLKTGTKSTCQQDATGCCAADSFPGYQSRMQGGPAVYQQVNQTSLSPSRTAVDFDGSMWVANRAFSGQSSVTKIANDPSQCIDRNKNGRIDTSSDVDGDGRITTDCNGNGKPDDLDDTRVTTCTAQKPQEFYGLDDECVLFTVNTNQPSQYGRPLALGRGSIDFGPSDAWAGTFQDGKFFRIDGATGQIKAMAQLPSNCHPYGATVDQQGILWAPTLGADPLCYLDTGNPSLVGVVKNRTNGTGGYGVSMDRDQNVWLAGYPQGHAFRYTPNRKGTFQDLGQGTWTTFQNVGGNNGAGGSGRGIAVDSRTQATYFAWMARDGGWIVRLDATQHPPQAIDNVVNAAAFPAMRVAGSSTIGAGVDRDQHVWGISYSGSVATRIMVNQNGDMSPPNTAGQPAPGTRCPAGDTCPLKDASWEPYPYTYSDFTGFGLRNFTNPRGSYNYLVRGCVQGETRWVKVEWSGDVPPMTKITTKARAGKNPMVDQTWGQWTIDAAVSPADLVKAGLTPNAKDSNYLEVEFDLSTQDKSNTPKLKGFKVWYECLGGIG